MREIVCVALLVACGACGGGSSSAGPANDAAAGPGTDAGADSSVAGSTTCDLSKPFGPATKVSGFDHSVDLRLSADGLTGYFGDSNTADLYATTRASTTSPWTTPTALDKVNAAYGQDESPSVTGDGLKLYFASDRSAVASYVYVASRADTAHPFTNATSVTIAQENGALSLRTPFIRADEGVLYYAADPSSSNVALFRAANSGKFFAEAAPLAELDSPSAETNPAVTPDDKIIYFSSQRSDGGAKGDFDVWFATRASASGPFGAPANVAELNTARAELVDFVTPDGCTLYFHSDRNAGVLEPYVATRPN
jgi:hypothetical protein